MTVTKTTGTEKMQLYENCYIMFTNMSQKFCHIQLWYETLD